MTIKKNIPNIITLSRIAFTSLFVLVICEAMRHGIADFYIILCFLAIVLSDFLDGRLARKIHSVTSTGAKLDIAADFIYMLGSVGTFVYFGVLPAWFLLMLIAKFIEFVLTSRLLSQQNNSQSFIYFDKWGRLAATMSMLLPGVFAFRLMINDYILIMRIYIIIIASLFCVSSAYRLARVDKMEKLWPPYS